MTLDVDGAGARLTLRTPEHSLHVERAWLEPVIGLLDNAYIFRQTFPELKPRFQEPLRTCALRIARRVHEEIALARIHGGGRT